MGHWAVFLQSVRLEIVTHFSRLTFSKVLSLFDRRQVSSCELNKCFDQKALVHLKGHFSPDDETHS